jgi:hypothetical protein
MSEVNGRPRPVRPATTRTVSPMPRAAAGPPAVNVQEAGDVAVFAASFALAAARSAFGLATRTALGTLNALPVPAPLRHRLDSAWHAAQARGREQRAVAIAEVRAIADAVVPRVVDEVLSRTDIPGVVDQLDVAAIVDRLDLDAIVARVDIDAVIARVDLIGLADYIVNGIDLPAIIRSSSESVTVEMVRGIRRRSADADEVVERVVDRALLRRASRRHPAPAPNGTPGSPPR